MLTFDPYDPEHLVDGVPFDVLGQIREDGGIARTPQGGWYIARHVDVEATLKNVETYVADLARMSGLDGLEQVPPEQHFLSEIPEPRHGEIRRLYNACFGAHRTRAVEDHVREVCDELVTAMLRLDVVDLQADYALHIPGRVMAHIMELPPEAPDLFLLWSADETLMLRPATPGVAEGGPPIHAFFAEQLAAARAGENTNRVFSVLTDAEIEGAPLTDLEILTQLQFMVMAGVHTTRGLLTHVVQRLALDPELFARLDADRTLVPAFVEESLRHDAPVQRTTRRCTHDTSVGGQSLAAGEWVEVGIGSANRDERHHDAPDDFRLDRPDARDHLAFGAGSHVCPGATLARYEAVTAVETLLDRLEGIDTVPGATYPPLPGNLGAAPVNVTLRAR